MYRRANIFFHTNLAGVLAESEFGYEFEYNQNYLDSDHGFAISKTLPTSQHLYQSKVLFAFFDGLIPEGWLLDIAIDSWKVNARDRFGILLACCQNTIGAVSIKAVEDEKL